MANKIFKSGLLLMMFLVLTMSVSATISINTITFPEKIGSGFEGPAEINSTNTEDSTYLLKTEWYRNDTIIQQDSYIDNSFKQTSNPIENSSALATNGVVFNNGELVLIYGRDDVSPGETPARIVDRSGNVLYTSSNTVGRWIYGATFAFDKIWMNTNGKIITISATDWSDNSTYTETAYVYTTTTSIPTGEAKSIVGFGDDLIFFGFRNAPKILNATNVSQVIKAYTTVGNAYGVYDDKKDVFYVADSDSVYEYNYTDGSSTGYNTAYLNVSSLSIFLYMFGNSDELFIVDYPNDQIFGLNTSNLSQMTHNITYNESLSDYFYESYLNDPNFLWLPNGDTRAGISSTITGIDRDLDQVIIPTGEGTSPFLGVSTDNNEYWLINFIKGNLVIKNALKYATSGEFTLTNSFDGAEFNPGDNLTLSVSAFSQDAVFVDRSIAIAEVYNNSIDLEYPMVKTVIQRNESGYGTLHIFGNYTGDPVTSINMTYTGPISGTLNIPVNASNQFNTNIDLYQGDYILEFEYNDVVMEENREFGVGDLIVIHGQSNAVNSDNAGKEITESSHGVYLLTRIEDTTCFFDTYRLGVLGTTNRWSELGQGASISEDVPVSIINFAVGGRGINYINTTCFPLNLVVLDEVTGGQSSIKGVYYYGSEADSSHSVEQFYGEIDSYSSKWFDNVSFPLGNLFSIGQTLQTPGSNVEVREAIQNAWYNLADIYKGSVMYDIKTSIDDSVHPSGMGKYVFTERNNLAALNAMYGLYTSGPVLENSYMYNSSRLLLYFDSNNLEISDWEGNADTTFTGLKISGASINSSNISDVTVNGDLVIVDFNEEILLDSQELTLCNDTTSCYDEPVIRESSIGVPVEIVWNGSVDYNAEFICSYDSRVWYNGACYDTLSQGCTANQLDILDGECVAQKTYACNSIGKQVYDSFNLGVVALIVLAASLIVGILMTAFGGAGFDKSTLMITFTTIILSAIMFLIGIIIYGYVSGAIC